MVITNWLAKAEGCNGLVFPSEFTTQEVRIYGQVYGNPNFKDGEYVQTAVVASYDGVKVTTISGEQYTLLKESLVYEQYLKATSQNLLVVKKWYVENGLLKGRTLEGVPISGRVVSQSFRKNVCILKDGRRIFVDWLSKAPNFNPNYYPDELLVFGIARCMPDILGKHYLMFKQRNDESCR